MHLATGKARIRKHSFQLSKCIGIATFRSAKHLDAEGGFRWRNAIIVWNKLQRYRASTFRQRCMNLP